MSGLEENHVSNLPLDNTKGIFDTTKILEIHGIFFTPCTPKYLGVKLKQA